MRLPLASLVGQPTVTWRTIEFDVSHGWASAEMNHSRPFKEIGSGQLGDGAKATITYTSASLGTGTLTAPKGTGFGQLDYYYDPPGEPPSPDDASDDIQIMDSYSYKYTGQAALTHQFTPAGSMRFITSNPSRTITQRTFDDPAAGAPLFLGRAQAGITMFDKALSGNVIDYAIGDIYFDARGPYSKLTGGVGTTNGTFNAVIHVANGHENALEIEQGKTDIIATSGEWLGNRSARFVFNITGQSMLADLPVDHVDPNDGTVYLRMLAPTNIKLYWASGPSDADILNPDQPIVDDIPIDWNADSITFTVGNLHVPQNPDRPITHLVAVANLANSLLTEPINENPINSISALKIFEDPTVEIVVDPPAPIKKKIYNVTVKVTNNSNLPMTLIVDAREIYPGYADRIHLIPILGESETKTFSEIERNDSRELKLDPLMHNWDWLSRSNPIDDEVNRLKNDIQEIEQNGLNIVAELRSARFAGLIKKVLSAITFVTIASDAAKTKKSISVPIKVTVDDPDGHVADVVKEEPVELTIPTPDKYLGSYAKYHVLNWTASASFGLAITSLFSPVPELAAPGLLAAAYLYDNARDAYEQALDPPDPNYTTLAQPQRASTDVLDDQSFSFTTMRGYDALNLNSFARAEAASRDRSDGAKDASDWEWQANQLIRASELASEGATFSTRQIARGILMDLYESVELDPESADIIASLENVGLPGLMVDALAELGWTPAQIESLRLNLIEAVPVLNYQGNHAWTSQLTAMITGASALQEIEQAVRIRVNELDASVRDLTTEERASLDQMHAEVEAMFGTNAPSLATLAKINTLIAETRTLVLETNNVEAVYGDLDYAYGALSDFQKFDWTPQGLQQHVDDLLTAGQLNDTLVADLRSITDATLAELRAGDFIGACNSLTAFSYSVRAVSGVTPAVRTQLIDYALILRDLLDTVPWQNDLNPLHVNNDADISPNDALVVINWLNDKGAGILPSPLDTLIRPHAQIDTTGDNNVSPLDALLVINWLNNNPRLGGEGFENSQQKSPTRDSGSPAMVFNFSRAPHAAIIESEVGHLNAGHWAVREMDDPKGELIRSPRAATPHSPFVQWVRTSKVVNPLLTLGVGDIDALFATWGCHSLSTLMRD